MQGEDLVQNRALAEHDVRAHRQPGAEGLVDERVGGARTDLAGLVALGHGMAPVDDAQAGDVATGNALEHLLNARHVALAHRALHALDDRLADGEHQVRSLLDRPVALVPGNAEHEEPENQSQRESERDDQLRSELHSCTHALFLMPTSGPTRGQTTSSTMIRGLRSTFSRSISTTIWPSCAAMPTT